MGAPSATPWETTVNDWRWVHGVNVMGAVNGVLAFVAPDDRGGRAGPRGQHRRWSRQFYSDYDPAGEAEVMED